MFGLARRRRRAWDQSLGAAENGELARVGFIRNVESKRVRKYLGHQSLEETREAFLSSHVAQNSEAALGVLKVAVLDTGLDDIERSRHNERCRGTGDRCNKVLEP